MGHDSAARGPSRRLVSRSRLAAFFGWSCGATALARFAASSEQQNLVLSWHTWNGFPVGASCLRPCVNHRFPQHEGALCVPCVDCRRRRRRCPVRPPIRLGGTADGMAAGALCVPVEDSGRRRRRCPARAPTSLAVTTTAPAPAPCASRAWTADGAGDGALCVPPYFWAGLPTALAPAPCASRARTADGADDSALLVPRGVWP